MIQHPRSCRRSIGAASAVSAGIAAVLSPIPLADEVILAPLYALLALALARIHHVSIVDVPWDALAHATLKGLVARAAANVSVALVPGVAAVANALTAAALTGALGRYFDALISAPQEAPASLDFAGA